MPDVVVIGLGPAGIVAAHVLADAGHSVVAVQAEAVPHGTAPRTPGSPAHAPGGRAPLASPPPTVRTSAAEEATPQPAPPAGRDGIGGSKMLAAPQSYRLDEWSLRARSAFGEQHGMLPADADLVDWPIRLDELAPWYDVVERAMRVGVRPATAWTDRMSRAAASLGWEPFPAPAAASKDASSLLDADDIEIVRATVTAILRDSTGAVSGVEYVDAAGGIGTLEGRAVVVAASVIPTVRLLLLSGLTGGGEVGRRFMSHNSFVVHGDFPGVDLGRRHTGPASAVAVAEFEDGRFDHTGLGFHGGSILQAAMTGPWTEERIVGPRQGSTGSRRVERMPRPGCVRTTRRSARCGRSPISCPVATT